MKQLIIVMNGKGGVGKSTLSINLVQLAKDRKLSFEAIDTDNENSTLKRFHPDVIFVNIERPLEIDRMFAGLSSHDFVLVDCRAASTDLVLSYFREVKVFELLQEMEAELVVVMPVNHEADSIEQLRIITTALGGNCRYIVVKNQVHSDQFRMYEASRTRSHLINELGCEEIVMPKLYDWLVTLLNEKGITVTEAIRHPEVSLMDRQRLKNWQSSLYERIDAVQTIRLSLPHPPKKGERKGQPQ